MGIEIKAGQAISANQLMNKFDEKINVDLSNMPILPCSKRSALGRNNCTIAYADKAGIADVAQSLVRSDQVIL